MAFTRLCDTYFPNLLTAEESGLPLDLSSLSIESDQERGQGERSSQDNTLQCEPQASAPYSLQVAQQLVVSDTPDSLPCKHRLEPLSLTATSPIDSLPSSLIFQYNCALLTPFGYSSASPSPVHFIPIVSPQQTSPAVEPFENGGREASGLHQVPSSPLFKSLKPSSPHSPFIQESPVEYPKRSLFAIPESPAIATLTSCSSETNDSIRDPFHIPFATSTYLRPRSSILHPTIGISSPPIMRNKPGAIVPPSPIYRPKKRTRTFKSSRARPGFLRNLPVFSIPSTPIPQSPMTPSRPRSPLTHRGTCSPLKSPFLIRRKSEESAITRAKEDGGYFVRVRVVA
ncbi:hypothetical protein E1B28_005643 [Marasmius oreades]|uniref:Uncharacterized protein n=1 Tax=Marasmius oreades TaxID=181124 RepID=A0A9P7UW81_9AGAR|nr:uncharacterized protein E1B28_005643 [Marasmius oreades]KAG7094834.1 hypothetical protein E1B28_005643 [Marasmius oreades]